jgi:MFS family permease
VTARSAETEERLLTGRAGRLSLVLAAGWFAVLLGRSALPPLMPEIVSVLQIPPAYAGFALTLMMATHSVLQYPGGRFSDQLTRTTVIVFSLGAAVLGFALVMTATSYPTLLLGMGVVGVGSGLYFSPARAFLSDLYVERLGQALGLQTTAGLAGSALAGGVATVAVAVAVWRATFLLPVVLVVAVAVALHVLSHEGYRVGAVDLAVRETGARLVARPEVRLLLAVATVRAFANQGVIGFLPLFLQTAKGFSPAFANLSYGALFAVGAVASPIVGNVSDRFPRRRVLAVLLTLFLLGVAVTVVGTSRVAVAAGVLLVAVGTWGFAPVMQATLMDRFSAESVGGDFGALKMVYTGVGSLGPTYVGVVAGRASYEVAFGGAVALLAVGVALLVWWSPE